MNFERNFNYIVAVSNIMFKKVVVYMVNLYLILFNIILIFFLGCFFLSVLYYDFNDLINWRFYLIRDWLNVCLAKSSNVFL